MSDVWYDDLIMLAPANISQDQRDQWKNKGFSMPDGSFPIPNKDFLRRAISSFGRAPAAAKAAVKAHIIRRAKALGAAASLPPGWGVGAPAKVAASHGPAVTRLIKLTSRAA